jgi:hypothetical protein
MGGIGEHAEGSEAASSLAAGHGRSGKVLDPPGIASAAFNSQNGHSTKARKTPRYLLSIRDTQLC